LAFIIFIVQDFINLPKIFFNKHLLGLSLKWHLPPQQPTPVSLCFWLWVTMSHSVRSTLHLTTHLLIIASLLHLTHAIKSRTSWNQLFHSNAHQRYDTEEKYQQKLDFFLSMTSSHLKQLYVLQYQPHCGHLCHQFLLQMMRKENMKCSLQKKCVTEFHYEILNSDHGVMRTSLSVLQSLRSIHRREEEENDFLLDFIPFLPELKYDLEGVEKEDFILEYCPKKEELKEITLLVVFTLLPSDDNVSSFILYGELQEPTSPSPLIETESSSTSSKQETHSILLSCSLFTHTPFITILEYYSNLPAVHWLEIRSPSHPFTKYANSLTQIDPPHGFGVSHTGHNIFQLYRSMNLTGHGEIIGISDTGIDVSSCSFYDPNTPILYNSLNPSHRKILYYNSYIDSSDSYGHGTAVSGVAAGECIYPPDTHLEKRRKQYDSVASQAKIAFFDISGTDNVLRLPADINTNLLQVLYATGARVMSISWGSSGNKYTIDSRSISTCLQPHLHSGMLTSSSTIIQTLWSYSLRVIAGQPVPILSGHQLTLRTVSLLVQVLILVLFLFLL
jgi:hypothetical protein